MRLQKLTNIPVVKRAAIYALCIVHCALFAGCGDFLELKPLNDIVLENYWTEKADVQSVINSCYSGLADNECLTRMFVWGEVRSDNVQRGASTGGDLQQVLLENLLETNGFTRWVSFYQVINRCNTVIQYAPVVAAKDPNYTDGDRRANVAEATALRALCYFYLIRAFRDVPYVTTPSSDDSNIEGHYRVPATDFHTILGNLIADLESVRNDAVPRYPRVAAPVGDDLNSGRITRSAIDAMLCDMYLWQGEYAKSMEAANRVLSFKMQRYEELRDEEGLQLELELFADKYPLIPEQLNSNTAGEAYDAIFGTGHSFESIFELGFINQYGGENKMVADYFGSSETNQGQLFATECVAKGVYEASGNELWDWDDCRFPECVEVQSDNYLIRKYMRQMCRVQIGNESNKEPVVSSGIRSTKHANWIIYRLTDVMLMKAEAALEFSAQTGIDSTDVAFELVQTVNRRARNLSEVDKKNLKRDDYQSIDLLRQLVQDERHRELIFEGKRWFDLMRIALREGDNTNLISQVVQKHQDNTAAIRVKLRSPYALFWPINRTELDVNPSLKQNPAYQTKD